MWGRFSTSTETIIDQDLEALEGPQGGLDALIEKLRLWHGGLRVEPGHFAGWSLGARFYPILYMLTRMGGARDWGTGLPLKANMLGKMSRLEVHHIFPKARLYERDYKRAEVNALANFCFLTKDTNLDISDRLPEAYFAEVEEKHPGALASQWIPMDPALWRIDRYLDFLEARKALLAVEANRRFEELLHGETHWLSTSTPAPVTAEPAPIGGITSEVEELELETLNDWVEAQGLPRGQVAFDYADSESGMQKAVFDLAWPERTSAKPDGSGRGSAKRNRGRTGARERRWLPLLHNSSGLPCLRCGRNLETRGGVRVTQGRSERATSLHGVVQSSGHAHKPPGFPCR